jgi:hypothetical protein
VHTIAQGGAVTPWTQVDSSFGASTIYNTIATANNKKLFTVKTVDNDNAHIVFGDGVFSEIPRGMLRVYYRTGINQTYTLNVADLGTVSFSFKYVAADGNTYTATFTAAMQAPISNASSQETVTSIKQHAGRVFAAQDRMITAADYASYPQTVSNNVLKIKAINRTYAGHSRYIAHNDPTAQYQNVDISASDGYLFTEPQLFRREIPLPTVLTDAQLFEKMLSDMPLNAESINLFYTKYAATQVPFADANAFQWQQITKGFQGSTGYFTRTSVVERVGNTATTAMQAANIGAVIEFIEAPYGSGAVGNIGTTLPVTNGGSGYVTLPTISFVGSGFGATATPTVLGGVVTAITITNGGTGYINPTSVVVSGGGGSGATATVTTRTSATIWARVIDVVFDGYGVLDVNGNPTGLNNKGQGSVVLDRIIPNTARVKQIYPSYSSVFTSTERLAIIAQISLKNSFGMRYDQNNSAWHIILAANMPPPALNSPNSFSLGRAGDTTSTNGDNSWMFRMDYAATGWKMLARHTRFVFGSDTAVRFYNQTNKVKFNQVTNKPERDRIVIAATNTMPGSSLPIGTPMTLFAYKYYAEQDGYTDNHKIIVTLADINNSGYPDDPTAFVAAVGQNSILLNAIADQFGNVSTVHSTTGVGSPVTGRANLSFTWTRVSDTNYTINPALTNIIDIFVMTSAYDLAFRKWLQNDRTLTTRPPIPLESSLVSQFSSLNLKKAVSDTVVYRPAQYRLLFGNLADTQLQGMFRVIKVTGTPYTDSEVKVMIIDAINLFFDATNWDFGEIFYFTELSAFIHQYLQGIISSVIIVPVQPNGVFGHLFQVTAGSNELFIPDVRQADIQIVNTLANNLI